MNKEEAIEQLISLKENAKVNIDTDEIFKLDYEAIDFILDYIKKLEFKYQARGDRYKKLEEKISKTITRIEDLRQYFDEDVQADFVLILDILDGRLSK